MKITSQHLEQVRVRLLEKNASLDTAFSALSAAATQHDQLTGEVRALQGSFDIFAAAFAQDADLSGHQLDDLPAEAQQVLGYAKPPKA